MHVRLTLVRSLALAPLLAVSVAHAQAPGEIAPQPVPEAAPCACAADPMAAVMANRWSIGLSAGGMSLHTSMPVDKLAFGIAELALRFRATPHFELEASLGGGRQQLDNGDSGDLAVNTAALALRYRINPAGAWNWFATAGLGVAQIASHDASQQARDAANQPLALLGLGLERRFEHLAIQAEIRAVALGKRGTEDIVDAGAEMTTTASPAARQQRSGAAVSIGLSYYF